MFTTDDGTFPPTSWTRYKFEEPTYANSALLLNPPLPIISIGSSQGGASTGALNLLTAVKTAACNPGEFFMPQGIAVSPDGTSVYVVDWALNQTAAPNNGYYFGRVQKFDSVGTWKLQWYQSTNLGPFIQPKGIAVDKNGLVYLSWFAGVSGLVEQFNADGTASGKAFTAAPGAVAINRPEGVALDTTDPNYPAGILYVSDKYNHRIIIYDAGSAAGSLIGQVATTGGSGGSDAGQVRYPAGLAVDSLGYLYAVDAGNKRVEKWSPLRLGNGFLCIFGGAGNLLDPWGIAVSPDGTFAYVADSRDHRVVLYKSAPSTSKKK
jgi:sugar lactone lactonase YvrE